MSSYPSNKDDLLTPLYAAIDSRNHKLALKLSSSKQLSRLGPIVSALRSFSCGKLERYDEAVRAIDEVTDPRLFEDPRTALIDLLVDPLVLNTISITVRQLPPSHRLVSVNVVNVRSPPLDPSSPPPPPVDLMLLIFSRVFALSSTLSLSVPPPILSLHFTSLLSSLCLTYSASTTSPEERLEKLGEVARAAQRMYKATGMTTHLFTAATLNLLAYTSHPSTLLPSSSSSSSPSTPPPPPPPPTVAMLPKLAAATLKRAVLSKPHPSSSDYRAYSRSLLLSSSPAAAVELLRTVAAKALAGSPLAGIHDEETVREADGGVTQMGRDEAEALLASALIEAGDEGGAEAALEGLLLRNPDEWSYYASLFSLLEGESGESGERLGRLDALAGRVIEEEKGARLRTPRLMRLKIACSRLSSAGPGDAAVAGPLKTVLDQVTAYYAAFSKLACCSSDLASTSIALRTFFSENPETEGGSLESFLMFERSDAAAAGKEGGGKEERDRDLGRYVTATKLLVAVFGATVDKEAMIREHALAVERGKEGESEGAKEAKEGGGSKEEVRRGDELVVMVGEVMLAEAVAMKLKSSTDAQSTDAQSTDAEAAESTKAKQAELFLHLLSLTSLLKKAISTSPQNSSLSLLYITATQLLPSPLSFLSEWNKLQIKQVQLDSLSYRLLNPLVDRGMYQEAAVACGDLIGFHRSSASCSPDYVAKAFSQGNYEQAVEMIEFQAERMDKSLQLLDCKARILCLAPLATNSLGEADGMCGGDADGERAGMLRGEGLERLEMRELMEKDWGGATLESVVAEFSDNRDLAVPGNVPVYEGAAGFFNAASKEETVSWSAVQFAVQAVLAATLSAAADYKPPKKGSSPPAVAASGREVQRQLERADLVMSRQADAAVPKLWTVLRESVHAIASVCVTGGETTAAVSVTSALAALAATRKDLQEADSAVAGRTELLAVDWLGGVCRDLPTFMVPLTAVVVALRKVTKKKKTVGSAELKVKAGEFYGMLREKLVGGETGGTPESVLSSLQASSRGGGTLSAEDCDLLDSLRDVMAGCAESRERVGRVLGEMRENLERGD